ncbi:hypothetical protein [Sulfitobacter sp. 915]|uniref:hypothetical protein n=1 Tax=Sulfitobacter sp. 915 TaxID=3368558 RepID=UPI003745AB13
MYIEQPVMLIPAHKCVDVLRHITVQKPTFLELVTEADLREEAAVLMKVDVNMNANQEAFQAMELRPDL